MKLLITGSSGLVGSALINYLPKNQYEVWRLMRRESGSIRTLLWNPLKGFDVPTLKQMDAIGFDAVVHLAGENVGERRWTESRKETLRESRITVTENLCKGLMQLTNRPSVLISASAIGYYGDRGLDELKESASPGKGFLAGLCTDWEKEANVVIKAQIRSVNLRIGIVLDKKGGALQKMIKPFKMGVGAPLGKGSQMMSWISLNDLIRVIEFCLNQPKIIGPVNAVSTGAVSNLDFSRILAKILKKKMLPAIPEFVLKLMFGEMAKELLLASCLATPHILTKNGFKFEDVYLEFLLRKFLQAT